MSPREARASVAPAPGKRESYSSAPPPAPEFDVAKRAAALAEVEPRLGQRVREFFERERPPSLAVAMVVDDKVVFTRLLGVRDRASSAPPTQQTLYRIGSITKTFTATTLLALRDAGRLRLDEPAETYLPELAAVEYPFPDAPRITLRHLLTHTSGLPRLGDFDYTRADRDVTEAELLESLPRTRLEQAPGVRYSYSNLGLGLLGVLIGRVAPEKSLRAAVARYVTEPLSLSHTTFEPLSVDGAEVALGYASRTDAKPASLWRLGASESAGGLWSTLSDMSRWVAAQLGAWPPRAEPDTGFLRRASLREAHTGAFSAGFRAGLRAESIEVDSRSIGLSWHGRASCDYERVVEHSGGIDGFSSTIAFVPERGFGFVVLASALDISTDELTDELLRESAVLPTREVVAAAATTEAVKQLAATLGDCDDARYERLLTPLFRARLPLATFKGMCGRLKRRHGACEFERALSLESPYDGRFLLRCERGRLEAEARVEGGPAPARLKSVGLRSSGFPAAPNVRRAAREVLALYTRWSPEHFRRAFADSDAEPRFRATFQELALQLGACRLPADLDSAPYGDGDRGIGLPLSCERGVPVELRLELDEAGKIAEVGVTRVAGYAGRCGAVRREPR